METNRLRKLKPGKEFDHLFDAPTHTDNTIRPNATIPNTVGLIKKTVKNTLAQTERIAKELQGNSLEDTCHRIWDFVYEHIQYKKDAPGREQIRSPRRSWADRTTGVDCDCYTTFISSVLMNLKISHLLRITKYKADWQHIYVIVPKDGNVTRDYPFGGNYFTIDCVTDQFDYEVKFTGKQDHPMKLEFLDGIERNSFGDLGRKAKKYESDKAGEWKPKERKTIFGKALQKIGRGVAKVGLAPIRSAYLLALKTNIAGLANKLRWAYTSPDVAAKYGISAEQYDRVKMQLLKIQDRFGKAGGNVINLKNAILRGKGNKDNKVPLSGLSGYYDLDFDGLPDADWSAYSVDSFGHLIGTVNGLGDLGIVAATVLPIVLAVIKAAASALKDIKTSDESGEDATETVEGLGDLKARIAKTQRLVAILEAKGTLTEKEQKALAKAKATLAKLSTKSATKTAKKDAKIQKKATKVAKKAAKKQLKPTAQKLATRVAAIDQQIKAAETANDYQKADDLQKQKKALLASAQKQKLSLTDILDKAAEIVGKVTQTAQTVKDIKTGANSNSDQTADDGTQQNNPRRKRYPNANPDDGYNQGTFPLNPPAPVNPPVNELDNKNLLPATDDKDSNSTLKVVGIAAAAVGGLYLLFGNNTSQPTYTNRKGLNGTSRRKKKTQKALGGFSAVPLS